MFRLILIISLFTFSLRGLCITNDDNPTSISKTLNISLFQQDVSEYIRTGNSIHMLKWVTDTFYVRLDTNIYYGTLKDLDPTFQRLNEDYRFESFNTYIRDNKNQVMVAIKSRLISRTIYIIFELDNSKLKTIYIF